MSEFKNWFKENQALSIALLTQLLIFGGYIISLESRVSILEKRGSPHLQVIDNRLTVLESQTQNNRDRLDRLVDKATK